MVWSWFRFSGEGGTFSWGPWPSIQVGPWYSIETFVPVTQICFVLSPRQSISFALSSSPSFPWSADGMTAPAALLAGLSRVVSDAGISVPPSLPEDIVQSCTSGLFLARRVILSSSFSRAAGARRVSGRSSSGSASGGTEADFVAAIAGLLVHVVPEVSLAALDVLRTAMEVPSVCTAVFNGACPMGLERG